MQETQVQSLGQEDLLEKGMATCSSILACEIPCTEDPGGLQSMGSQRVRHNLATKPQTTTTEVQNLEAEFAQANQGLTVLPWCPKKYSIQKSDFGHIHPLTHSPGHRSLSPPTKGPNSFIIFLT